MTAIDPIIIVLETPAAPADAWSALVEPDLVPTGSPTSARSARSETRTGSTSGTASWKAS